VRKGNHLKMRKGSAQGKKEGGEVRSFESGGTMRDCTLRLSPLLKH
jgi:hypothetical protein